MRYIIFLFFLLMPSCYKDYVNFSINYASAVYNNDSSAIAYLAYTRISKPAKGVLTLPDGGKPLVLYNDVSLFYYSIESDSLIKVMSFGNLVYNKTRWISKISLKDDYLAFSLVPLGSWKDIIDKSGVYRTYNKYYRGIFVYNIQKNILTKWMAHGHHPVFSSNARQMIYLEEDSMTQQIKLADIEGNNKLLYKNDSINNYSLQWVNKSAIGFKQGNDWYKIDVQTAKICTLPDNSLKIVKIVSPNKVDQIIEHIQFKDRGIDLTRIMPDTKNSRIEALVELKGNDNYRKALLQSLEKELSKGDIKKILNRIEEYKSGLNNYDRIIYEEAMLETITLLKLVLQK